MVLYNIVQLKVQPISWMELDLLHEYHQDGTLFAIIEVELVQILAILLITDTVLQRSVSIVKISGLYFIFVRSCNPLPNFKTPFVTRH